MSRETRVVVSLVRFRDTCGVLLFVVCVSDKNEWPQKMQKMPVAGKSPVILDVVV